MQKIIINPIQKIDKVTLEEIKKLRTNITFLYQDSKVIGITSSKVNEGKSLIAFWLAHTLADLGKKIVLVDADFRKDNKANIFEIVNSYNDINDNKCDNNRKNNKNGMITQIQQCEKYSEKTLNHHLTGKADREDIILESNINNLYLILSEQENEKPSELLNENLLSSLITFLRENYDYVIIDTPAVGEVTDAVLVSRFCDGCLMVIEPGVVSYKLAQRVKEHIENSGTKLLGVVLNKV